MFTYWRKRKLKCPRMLSPESEAVPPNAAFLGAQKVRHLPLKTGLEPVRPLGKPLGAQQQHGWDEFRFWPFDGARSFHDGKS
jgi:hypothetical protein